MASPSLLVLSLFLLYNTPLFLHVNATGGFTVDLIHRDSTKSSLSSFDRLRAAARRSRSRSHFFRHLMTTTTAAAAADDFAFIGTADPADHSDINIHAEVISSDLEYLMTLSIGTPPTTILATVDTATSLIFTPYNPKTSSSTYNELPCNSTYCSQLTNKTCGHNNECQYHYNSFVGHSNTNYSEGVLALETFTFHVSSNSNPSNNVDVPKVLAFGCSSSSSSAGVVGLGPGPSSLVSQLGSAIDWKFSYCLPPLKNNGSKSALHFGSKASFTGTNVISTPLIIQEAAESQYLLNLKTISLGSLEFSVWPDTKKGRTVIDTGTLFTYLPPKSFTRLKEELADLLAISYDPAGVKYEPLNMCYLNNEEEQGVIKVAITFGFEGGNVTLGGEQTFLQVSEDVACFAVLPISSRDDLAIFGSLAQQNLHIGYDLKEKQLSIAPTDCTKI